MSYINSTSLGYLSPVGDFSQHNVQTLGGASALWHDFFTQAMADQFGEQPTDLQDKSAAISVDDAAEPVAGSELLAQIKMQRLCDVRETEVKPPEPLFLPKAEFELDLLDKAAEPFPVDELAAQQQHLEFDSRWVRPVVMSFGTEPAEPGAGPTPRPLRLPIAEFEWDLADPYLPYPEHALVEQQHQLQVDTSWTRPVVLHNVRLAA
jgi:hypothetical protein